MKHLFSLSALCAAALLATAAAATPMTSLQSAKAVVPFASELLAREKSEGTRGKDPHATQGTGETIAREAESGGRGRDDPKGHRLSDDVRGDLLARAETSHGGKRRPAGKGGA